MSSDGNSSGNEGARQNAPKPKEVDFAWNYCAPVPGVKGKVVCNFCKKTIGGGGITRFKRHITGGDKNVALCQKCPQSVRDDFRKIIASKREKKDKCIEANKSYTDTLFNVQATGSSAESDDDMVYPPGCGDTAYGRHMYRRAYRESRRSEWEREEAARILRRYGPSGTGGGSGTGVTGLGLGRSSQHVPPVVDLDDEDDVFAQTKRKKGTVDVLLRSASARLKNIDEPGVRKAEPRQKTLKGMFSGAKEKVGKAVGKFFFAHGIPAHVATEPYLQHMVDVIGESGRGTKAPTAYELMHKYLPEQKKELEQWVKEQKILWAEYGVTLMCDGWTSGNRKQIINFLAHCRGSTIFLDSVDASGEVKEYSYLYKLMKKYMKVVGPENIVQIVTDNGSNFKKAGGKIMKNSPVYWTPCAAHCIDLILKDMGKLEYIKSVTIDAKLITGFIYNHSFLLNAMRRPEYCGGDLVRVGVTRFATNYLALDSLKNKRDGLRRLFNGVEWTSMKEHNTPLGRRIEELIANRAFWDKVTKVLKVMAPIVKVLRLVDGDKAATMPWLYDAMETMVENVKKAAPTSNAQYTSIIKKRWTDMLLHPLHKVAYYLNPRYHYSRQLGMKPDLMNAVRDVLNKLLTSTEERMQVLDQLRQFREGLGCFGHPNAVADRAEGDPCEWWVWNGNGAPQLRKIAIRILSQTTSAGGCERNWSTFNLIHSKRRNRLGALRLRDLVYVHYNMRLRARAIREANYKEVQFAEMHDPIDTAYTFHEDRFRGLYNSDDEGTGTIEDPLEEWMNEIGRPVLDNISSGRPDPYVEEQFEDASGVVLEEERRNRSPPERLEPEPEHVDLDMEIDRAVQDELGGASSASKSITTTSSGSKSKSDDDDDDGGNASGGQRSPEYPPTVDPQNDDRPYITRDIPIYLQERNVTMAEKTFMRKKTRGGKDYSGAPPRPHEDTCYRPPIATTTPIGFQSYPTSQYYTDSTSDIAESMGNMRLSDSLYPQQSFGDTLFGHPQAYYGYSGYQTQPPPQPEAELEHHIGYTYSANVSGPQGTYQYNSSVFSDDGGQSWSGGSSVIPVAQVPMHATFPQARQPPSDSESRSRYLRDLEDHFPRFGMMQFVSGDVHEEHVISYNTLYRMYMTWEQYVNHINTIQYAEQPTQPARHSTYN